MNYYNDNDPYICEWVRNLIKKGLVPDGEVDRRSIADVRGEDLRGFRQCHFFCGILGWVLALRYAGWPEEESVWTGSCPCQPFSSAGRLGGVGDKRHLWPHFRNLIAECRPATIFGEQVTSHDGREWLSGVRADLEQYGVLSVTPGERCREARLGRIEGVIGLNSTDELRTLLGISRVTLRTWERTSDPRLLRFWRDVRGLRFDGCCEQRTIKLGPDWSFAVDDVPIEHLTAIDPTTFEELVRVDSDPVQWCEYAVDEVHAVYAIAPNQRAGRRICVSYARKG